MLGGEVAVLICCTAVLLSGSWHSSVN